MAIWPSTYGRVSLRPISAKRKEIQHGVNMKTLEQAKSAKTSALKILPPLVGLAPVGIAGTPDKGYSLTVHLKKEVSDYGYLPQEIDGVKVVYLFVGNVTISLR